MKSIFEIIALPLITILTVNHSSVAQDTAYFSKDIKYEVKIKPFCNNSPSKDFSPFAWHNYLFITSSRLTEKNRDKINPGTNQPFLKVYSFDSECNQIDLRLLPSKLNDDLNCGPLSVALDTSLLVITKNYNKPNKEGVQNLHLTYFVRGTNGWSDEKSFPFDNKDFSFIHPCYDDRTSTLYFSSDMPGGFGKFDLYKAQWDGEYWGEPVNLGRDINSPYDEVFPSLNADGDLIYTSDHPGTTGGLDLVLFKNNKRYLLPEPLNTSFDDFSISFIDKLSGYFASNRDQASSDDNIYSFGISPADSFSYFIRVVDTETQLPVPNASVAFRATNPKLDGHLQTSINGEGLIYFGTENPFSVSFDLKKEGYKPLTIVSDNFHKEESSWVNTLSIEPKPVKEDTLYVIGIRPVLDYYIIVGSFRNKDQANQKAQKLRDEGDPGIVVLPPSPEGNYRLSYGKYSTPEEAKAALKSIKPKFKSIAWIYSLKR